MSLRQRFINVLNGKPTDKISWYADLSYLYDSLKLKNELPIKYQNDKGYLKFHIDLGVGIYFYAPFLWISKLNGKVTYTEQKKNLHMICEYKAGDKTITCVKRFMPKTFSWVYEKRFVETIDDLYVMLNVMENTEYTENYKAFKDIDDLWGEHGIAAALAPISVSPLQSMLARWAGVEKTIDLYMSNLDRMEEIFERMQQTHDTVFNIINKSDACYVEFPENLSSEITGKSFFEKYNMPYYKKRVEELKKAGKKTGIHIDGTLKPCLSMLSKCGFDVAEAVTPAPVGDVKLEDLRKTAGKDIIIMGGLPGALFSPQYTDRQFNRHLDNIMDVFKDDNRFILGVADQVPPDGLKKRIKAVGKIFG